MKVTGNSPGSPCWVQLGTSDMEAAEKFYTQLFGWTAEADPDPDAGGYTMLSLNGSPAAGLAPLMDPRQPVQWMVSFAADDVDATTEAAKTAGAQLWMGPMDVMDIGRWSLLSDPTGAAFSLWQSKGFSGFGVVDEPSAFGWIDLSTRDKDAALAFYKDLLGWQVWPSDMYPMVGLADKMFGGIMQMSDDMFPPDMPSHWNPFFVVADVDATAERARGLGGQVLHGPEDVPMENGPRIAVLGDPQGAAFGIHKSNAAA